MRSEEEIVIHFRADGVEDAKRGVREVSTTIENQGRTQIRTTKSLDAQGRVTEKVTKKTRAFRMENLSLMFTGMQLSRTFGDMTQGALELTGVTDIFGTAMNDIMITTLEPFLPTLYDFAEGLLAMTDGQKEAIGKTVILGQVMGGLMSGMGQVLMFVDGLKEMGGLAGLFTNLKEVFGDLGSLIGKPLLTTIGVDVPDDIKDKFSSALTSKWGKVGIGLVGGIVTIDAMMKLGKGIETEGLTLDSIITDIQAASGLSMMAYSAGAGKKGAAAIGIMSFLIIKDIDAKGITAEGISNALTQATGTALLFTPHPISKGIGVTLILIPEIWKGGIVEMLNDLGDFIDKKVGVPIRDVIYGGNVGYQQRKIFESGIPEYVPEKYPKGRFEEHKDFISRPGMGVSSFSPDDTIIGMKDISQLGGGETVINVTVQGNASRETADEIANQIDRVLDDRMRRIAR